MKKLTFLLFPLLALAVGGLSASLSRAGLEGVYPLLIKSPLTPPDAVFPIVWNVLYVLMGLGLALCKSIITAHGGEITVADHAPHGTVFTFTIPIEEVELHE